MIFREIWAISIIKDTSPYLDLSPGNVPKYLKVIDTHDQEKTLITWSFLHAPLGYMVDCISGNAQDSERWGPKEFTKEEKEHCLYWH